MKQSSSFKSLLYSLCCCDPRGLKSFCSPGPVWEHHPWSITEALSGAWWWQRAPSPPAWSRFSFLGSLWDVLEPLDGLSYCEQCCRLCTPGSVPICCSHQLWSEMGTFLLCRGEHLARGWRHGCKPCAGKHDWCCSAGFPAAHFLELICPFWCSLSVGCFFPQQAPLRFVKHGYKAVLLFFFFFSFLWKNKKTQTLKPAISYTRCLSHPSRQHTWVVLAMSHLQGLFLSGSSSSLQHHRGRDMDPYCYCGMWLPIKMHLSQTCRLILSNCVSVWWISWILV